MGRRGLLLHVLLVLVVAAEILYLATIYRVRVDVTADQLYSFSPSTHSILDRLEQPLRIEAYFSDEDALDDTWRQGRQRINSYLDELVRVAGGKITVDFLDPGASAEVEDRARRVGILGRNLTREVGASTNITRVWQGLRLRYGLRTELVPLLLPGWSQPPQLEAQITPAMKLVTTEAKTKVAFMAWPYVVTGQAGAAPIGFDRVRLAGDLAGRYEWLDMRATDGVLVPDDIDLLVLFRPKGLENRTKYVIDQLLMRGGKVLAFVDTHEFSYHVEPGRQGPHPFAKQNSFRIDSVGHGGATGFLRQMAHYGVVVDETVVGDLFPHAWEPYWTPLGNHPLRWNFPYFFHPVQVDWSQRAADFARRPEGHVDRELAERYRERFTVGMNPDSEFNIPFLERGAGPGFFFPTALDLVDPLPEGVRGNIVMRTTPLSLAQVPPSSLNWLGPVADPNFARQFFAERQKEFVQQMQGSLRKQFPLVVDVAGRFTSFFAGKKLPAREGMPPPGGGSDPTQEPVDDDPDAAQFGPASQSGDDSQRDKDADPAPTLVAAEGARLVVVGDSEMVRDDLVTGAYGEAGGPQSEEGLTFFTQLLDTLSGDQELLALYRRSLPDRGQVFAERDVANEPQAAYENRLHRIESLWRVANVALPILVLLLLGLGVAWVRRAQKRQFLLATGQLSAQNSSEEPIP